MSAKPTLTRYQQLLAKERMLDRIVSVLSGARGTTVDTLENVPGLEPLARVYISRPTDQLSTQTSIVSIVPYGQPLAHHFDALALLRS